LIKYKSILELFTFVTYLINTMKKLFLTLTLVFFFPFGMSQELPLYLPTDGLIAYYLFNGNANDESGNGNHGTINGATLTTDRYNNADSAYAFDGFDDFIEAQIDQSSSFTVATWVKLNRNDQYFGFVQHKENCTRGGGYILGIDPNGNYRYTSSNCGECQPNPCANSYEIGYINSESGLLSSNLWYHLIVTNDGSGNYIFYLNGEVIGSESNDNMIFDYGIKPFSIGKYHDGSNLFYLDGSIDDIGLWSRALTEQEIQDVYTSSNGDILLNGVVSAENNQIKNVADPTEAQDVTTKSYVDSLLDRIEQLENTNTKYGLRVDYNHNSEVSAVTKLNNLNLNFTITQINIPNDGYYLTLQFPDEALPPVSIISYGYIGYNDSYSIGTFQANQNRVSGLINHNIVESDNSVTTDFFSDFNEGGLRLNVVNPSNFGASRYTEAGNFPEPDINKEAHAILIFSFN
jgi:hypothetical protein